MFLDDKFPHVIQTEAAFKTGDTDNASDKQSKNIAMSSADVKRPKLILPLQECSGSFSLGGIKV